MICPSSPPVSPGSQRCWQLFSSAAVAMGTVTAQEPALHPGRIRGRSAMDQPATELLLLPLPCHDVPVEQIFIIKTYCYKLLFELLLILQTKQQILTNPGHAASRKSLCHTLVFLQQQTVPGHSVLHWEREGPGPKVRLPSPPGKSAHPQGMLTALWASQVLQN